MIAYRRKNETRETGVSLKGRASDFDSEYSGSSPDTPSKRYGRMAVFWIMRAALNSEGGIHAQSFWRARLIWNRPRRRKNVGRTGRHK